MGGLSPIVILIYWERELTCQYGSTEKSSWRLWETSKFSSLSEKRDQGRLHRYEKSCLILLCTGMEACNKGKRIHTCCDSADWYTVPYENTENEHVPRYLSVYFTLFGCFPFPLILSQVRTCCGVSSCEFQYFRSACQLILCVLVHQIKTPQQASNLSALLFILSPIVEAQVHTRCGTDFISHSLERSLWIVLLTHSTASSYPGSFPHTPRGEWKRPWSWFLTCHPEYGW